MIEPAAVGLAAEKASPRGKALVFILAVAGSTLGALPAVLLLVPAWWLGPYAGVAAVIAFLSLRRLTPSASSEPSAAETAAAAVASIGPSASVSLVLIGWYWAIYGLVRLAAYLLQLAGSTWSPSPAGPARTVVLIMGLALGPVAAWQTTRGLWRQLCALPAGVRSPYYRLLLSHSRPILMGALGLLAGAVVLGVVIGADARMFYLWLAIYLAMPGSLLWQVGEEGARPRVSRPVEGALARLLEALGFKVVSQPRTGLPEVDPLLLKTDLLAERDGSTLLIAVKVRTEDAPPVEWKDASAVLSAAWTLHEVAGGRSPGLEHVEPVLVLVGKGPADSLRSFAGDETVRIIHIPDADRLTQALRTEDEAELLGLAHSTLGALAGDPMGPSSPVAAGAP